MKRISVVGTSGSGKTTFAGRLSEILGIPHVELDALHWEADWMPAPDGVFRSRVQQAINAESWVVDGNYGKMARDLVWERADTVVWLDFSLLVILSRLLRRTFRRAVLGEECCNGNREQLSRVFSRDSIILWGLQTYKRRRAEYGVSLVLLGQRGAQTVRLRSPKEADRWLAQLPSEKLNLWTTT
ncbi:MAG: adenylate kinase [Blastocatellales bacterium]